MYNWNFNYPPSPSYPSIPNYDELQWSNPGYQPSYGLPNQQVYNHPVTPHHDELQWSNPGYQSLYGLPNQQVYNHPVSLHHDELQWSNPDYQPLYGLPNQQIYNHLATAFTDSRREDPGYLDIFDCRSNIEYQGVKYETRATESSLPEVKENREKCETYVVYTKNVCLRSEDEKKTNHITVHRLKECNLHYDILGRFLVDTAVRYGGVIQVDGEFRMNDQERKHFTVLLSYEDYIKAKMVDEFRGAGVLSFNADISDKKLNRYLQELIRIELREEQVPPSLCGFDQWKDKYIFASAEFCAREEIPPILEKHFDSYTTQTFEECGRLFLEAARQSPDLNLFLTVNMIRGMGLLTTVLSSAGIRIPKAVFVKGNAEVLSKCFQVFDRGYSLQKPLNINVKKEKLESYWSGIRDEVLMLSDGAADSKYKKELGKENIAVIEGMLDDNKYTQELQYPFLLLLFSERLSQEISSEKAFLLDASSFTADCISKVAIRVMYDFDRKIVHRICSEMSDSLKFISSSYHQWYGKIGSDCLKLKGNREFLAILLSLMELIMELFSTSFGAVISKADLAQYLTNLVKQSENYCCGGNRNQEFAVVCNRMLVNGDLELFVHSSLSKGVSSSGSIPSIYLDDSYMYFTDAAFTAVSEQMQLSPNSCAVRKTLAEAGLLKPGSELQVQITLYDRCYHGRQYVTAVRRSILSEEALQKLQGGTFNFSPCVADDETRIPLGMDERGRMVCLSPDHLDLGNKHVLIIGDSGTGKSTVGNLVAISKYNQGENIIYLDFSNSNSETKMLSHGFEQDFYNRHIKRFMVSSVHTKDDLQLVLWEMQEAHMIPVFYAAKYSQDIEEFLEILYDLIVSDETLQVTLVIDEIHELDYGKGSALRHIMEMGRGNGVSLISILQAPHELKPKQFSILNQASVKLIFGLNDAEDARACMDKMGMKPLYKFAELLGDLPKRNCLVIGALEDETGVLCPKRFTKVEIPYIDQNRGCLHGI
ncbi:MAG: AAA family ATPase [Ruminococcus sp.]|nr:AAA family ATPase [Ruminococcus sp.]